MTKDKKPALSIIIPFAGEYPQVLFTIQSIAQSLIPTDLDFEIIAVDNYCKELTDQWNKGHTVYGPKTNKAGEAIEASARGNGWLKYMAFDERLSHWECKRLACQAAEADTFLFIDAHCVPTQGIDKMYEEYMANGHDHNSTYHMPLTYKILEWRRLVYKMVVENGFYGYSFTGHPGAQDIDPASPLHLVPCMSTCGMMISRKVYDAVGGWPMHMSAYGGGENFINYAMAVCGFKKYIYGPVTLHHHGENRDYHWTFDGKLRNAMTAHYLFGGGDVLYNMTQKSKGGNKQKSALYEQVITNGDLRAHRKIIKARAIMSLKDFENQWR